MNKKEIYVLIKELSEGFSREEIEDNISIESMSVFDKILEQGEEIVNVELTENGKNILQYLADRFKTNGNKAEYLTSKEIGEGLFISSRSVSGSMRKLIETGYIMKQNTSPIQYCITTEGVLKGSC